MDAELDALVAAFKAKGIARVSYKRAHSCVSLICNVQKTSQILERVCCCCLSIPFPCATGIQKCRPETYSLT